MGRKKQLNVTGNNIEDYNLQVKDFDEDGTQFQRIYLSIFADNETYKYEICEDTRFAIEYLRDKIPEELDFAIENFNRVKINEDSDRDYLHISVGFKDFSPMQVTGRRL